MGKNIRFKVIPRVIIIGIVGTIFLFVGVAIGFFSFWPGSALAVRVQRVIPFPIVSIGWTDIITSRDLGENMRSIRRFYESQDFSKVGMRIDFSTEDGKMRLKMREKDLLNKMLEDRAMERLARARDITVTPEEAQQGVESKLAELGTETRVEQSLARLYGWTLSDFAEKVVRPSLYEEKLRGEFEKDTQQRKAAFEKVQQAAEKLKQGVSFSNVAQEFSEGQTASKGGELGWFTLDDLAPDLQKPVEKAKRNVVSDIIESDLGFHILLVEETKFENGKQLYHLRQIFVEKTSFSDWLSEELRKLPIRVWSGEYQWNRDAAEVDFQPGSYLEFEKKLLEKADGDPTLLL